MRRACANSACLSPLQHLMRSRPLCSSHAWLHSTSFRKQAHDEQQAEVERIANHVEISLTELIQQADE
jgi:hypothetical protein